MDSVKRYNSSSGSGPGGSCGLVFDDDAKSIYVTQLLSARIVVVAMSNTVIHCIPTSSTGGWQKLRVTIPEGNKTSNVA